jgi:flagellar biosynthesis protein FlhA
MVDKIIARQKLPEVIDRYSHLFIPIFVVLSITLMIIPTPPALLDILITLDITLSIIILLVSMYIIHSLQFSVFPSILLLLTIFRLALNVASTRRILLHGHEGTDAAGQVIRSFGQFVVGGNYVVGMVIFLIIIAIQYIVINHGAVRVSEVTARFTLDAMPGKQMSIDADLNSGLIDEFQARERRKLIEDEADFYGSMDGAIRFTQRDAIASIIIIIINILGGLIIGVMQRNMQIMNALQTYTILTIGDGIVTAIPALIISVSGGIITTRASSESNLGSDVTRQILFDHRVFIIASVILLLFSLALFQIAFFILSIFLGIIAFVLYRTRLETPEMAAAEAKQAAEAAKSPRVAPAENIEQLLKVDPLELEVGYGLISLVDVNQNGELLERIKSIRRQCALDIGIIIPQFHIRDNLALNPNEYTLQIKDNEVARHRVMMSHCLAMDPGTVTDPMDGIETIEPAFGLPAIWIPEEKKEEAQIRGYTVVDVPTVITTHISEVLRTFAYEFITRQEVQRMLTVLQESHPKVVEELVPSVVSLGLLQKVIQNLLKERVPVRDMLTILETVGDYAKTIQDPEILSEFVRAALHKTICKQLQLPNNELHVVTLDPGIEQTIAATIQRTDHGSYLTLNPQTAQNILNKVEIAVNKFMKDKHPIILCSPAIRFQFKKLTARSFPNLTVLSHNEIPQNLSVMSLGVVN